MLLRGKFRGGQSGILLHISSLPSRHGIGTFGEEAFRFVDFLRQSRQRLWQILPLVPVGEGNSPYKSTSCFAGEILYIDLDFLIRDGLLDPDDLPETDFPQNVDFDAVREYKIPILKKAVRRFNTRRTDYVKFLRENDVWLEDYAVFSAAAEHFGSECLLDFDESIRLRMPAAMEEFCDSHLEEISFYKVAQFLFYSQYFALKKYAEKNGVKIVGDIPFYVAFDSADVWKSPESFKLGRDMTPVLVAGVPPDIFSETGQLWGNPIYDWEHHKKTDYLWWKRRLAHCKKLYDIIRIDHFRAFASYYTIVYGSPDAKSGTWEKGVGLSFWKSIYKKLGSLSVIAEDLGGDEPDVQQLVRDTGFPNMKILQFGFDGDPQNSHLPRNFERNCVCYTGTHDNDTVLGWYSALENWQRNIVNQSLPESSKPIPIRLISAAMGSRADMVIIPMQDWLCLGGEARMNTPGTSTGNWMWRMPDGVLTDELCTTVRQITKGRN